MNALAQAIEVFPPIQARTGPTRLRGQRRSPGDDLQRRFAMIRGHGWSSQSSQRWADRSETERERIESLTDHSAALIMRS